jgi:hypothetical protein
VAIVELLEREGLCTKQDLYGIITVFRRKDLLFELGREGCR